jgi:hypothetical protein
MIKITTDIPFKDAINIFKPFFDKILLTSNNKNQAYILTNNEDVVEIILSQKNNFKVNYKADLIKEKQTLSNQIEGINPNDLF